MLPGPERTEVLHPLKGALHCRHANQGDVRLVIQAAGDPLTPGVMEELLRRNLGMFSVWSMDGFHAVLPNEGMTEFCERLEAVFQALGMGPSGFQSAARKMKYAHRRGRRLAIASFLARGARWLPLSPRRASAGVNNRQGGTGHGEKGTSGMV